MARRPISRLPDARFRRAFERAPTGMAILHLDGAFAEVNDSFCQIVGYRQEQLTQLGSDAITHADDVEREQERIRSLLARRRETIAYEKRYVHASGAPAYVAVQASLLCGEDDHPTGYLLHVQDVTATIRQEEQMEHLASHDALTGLLNRHAFSRRLESHAAIVKRYQPVGAILVVNLDHFKFINDTRGHQAGDELLGRTAELLAGRLRSSDVLARLGADEFGVLLPKADGADAVLVAGSLLDVLREQAMEATGLGRRITACIGIATFDTASPSGEQVLVNADLAMYDAKAHGRDCAVLFTSHGPGQTGVRNPITWVHRIGAALQEDRFELLAQPIVNLNSGRSDHFELLLRMRDEDGELVPPSSFLNIAERLDMIEEIDAWVVSRGFRMLAELNRHRGPGPSVEINLSAASMGSRRLLHHIETEIEEIGIDPVGVIFEITETAALGSISRARAFGQRLSELGCRFALDDFGAGFGSFYYLKHLYFDLIKIDGEFVHNCRASDTDQLLIRAIVEIARGLRKQTVAECVSDDETIDLLRSIGVDYGQGYHLGVPAPLGDQLAPAAC